MPTSLFLHHFIIRYTVEGTMPLPEFAADKLKSAFGNAMAFIHGEESDIAQFFFHKKYADPESKTGSWRDAPAPYILRNVQPENKLVSGDIFSFELILFGSANNYFNALMPVLAETAKRFSFRQRCEINLFSIHELDSRGVSHEIFGTRGNYFLLPTHPIRLADFPAIKVTNKVLTLNFKTSFQPTNDFDDLRGFNFFEIVSQLAKRVHLLQHVYANATTIKDTDVEQRYQAAKKIKPLKIDLNNKSFARKRGHIVDGYTGEIVYKGDNLQTYLQLLLFGQWLHVGKNASLGCGQYTLHYK
ncbi:MAG: CRISPR system precrRNA processing endoribonuclease RAMP protein Cas6 [Chitinophagales bacterium]|nr:CRISPR system precrRNA processing endoribonuclease RAMP protein Cas6 [Chitinophagales bacterium]